MSSPTKVFFHVFIIFSKINKPLESVPQGSPSYPNFWWCTNGDILVYHTPCESSSPWRRNEPLGYYFTIIMRRASEASLFSLVFQGKKGLFITGRTSVGCQKNKTKHYSVPGMFVCVIVTLCVCVIVCVIQHRNWPLRSTILNAHGNNARPDGLCTRTHTNEAFSCWFCCNSFRVDRARRGNVCLSNAGMLSYPSACPEI